MLPASLQAIGMIDANGRWTGKYGVHSRAQFLASPRAQEMALTDYLRDTQRQLQANGASGFIGKQIDGQRARFGASRAGLIAAGHREGAAATLRYLQTIAQNDFVSRGLAINDRQLAIETRLRTFADATYE
jgi:hypothetical protein